MKDGGNRQPFPIVLRGHFKTTLLPWVVVWGSLKKVTNHVLKAKGGNDFLMLHDPLEGLENN